jgi:hypothetical protein
MFMRSRPGRHFILILIFLAIALAGGCARKKTEEKVGVNPHVTVDNLPSSDPSAPRAAATAPSRTLKAGDKVAAPWGGSLYLGTVKSVGTEMAQVLYEDDKQVRDVKISELQKIEKKKWRMGDRVMAVWSSGKFHPASIVAEKQGNVYTVAWEDGSESSDVHFMKLIGPGGELIVETAQAPEPAATASPLPSPSPSPSSTVKRKKITDLDIDLDSEEEKAEKKKAEKKKAEDPDADSDGDSAGEDEEVKGKDGGSASEEEKTEAKEEVKSKKEPKGKKGADSSKAKAGDAKKPAAKKPAGEDAASEDGEKSDTSGGSESSGKPDAKEPKAPPAADGPPKVDDKVAVQYEDALYLGTVKAISGDSAQVFFHNDKQVRQMNVGDMDVVVKKKWKKGDKVLAVWSSGKFYPGKIHADKGKGQYSIAWEDGSDPTEVDSSRIIEAP